MSPSPIGWERVSHLCSILRPISTHACRRHTLQTGSDLTGCADKQCVRLSLRFVSVAFAFPVGALLGFSGAAALCAGILMLKGTGNSDNDTITSISVGIMGFIVGAILIPWCTWRFTRPVPSPDNGKLSKLGLVCLLILGCISLYCGIYAVARTSLNNWYAIAVVVAGIGMVLIAIHQWLRGGEE